MRLPIRQASVALVLLIARHSAWAQPVITTVTPAANAVNVPRSQAVSTAFSQALQASSTSALQVFSARRGGLRTGHSGTTAVTGSALTFTPGTFDWLPGETVQLTLTTAARNASGQALGAARVTQFTAAVGGTGRGSFVPPVTNPNPATGMAGSVVLGDLDNDGDLDMVTSNQNSSAIIVRFNNGVNSGNFVAVAGAVAVTVGTNPIGVALGDIDGDGDLDLLATNANFGLAGSVSVRLNDGAGRFTAPATNPNVAVGNEPNHLALGDIDGDGDLDLVTANSSFSSTVSVRLNSGLNSGNFVAPATNSNPVAGQNPRFVALGDVDGDGDLDLVVANSDDIRLSIMLNSGLHSGNFVLASNPTVGTQATSLALGDIDGDGDLDIVVGKADGTNTVYVLSNTGLNSGTFGYGPGLGAAFADTNPISVALGDVDADGDLDIVTANTSTSSVSVRLNVGLNSGTFGGYDPTHNFPVDGNARGVALGDLDGDGDLDLVSANGFNASTSSVRLNQLGPPPVVPPTLTGFSPTSGPVGIVVTLYGTGFTGTTAISFNGTPVTNFTVVSATVVTVTVPVGATTGPIALTAPTGTATSTGSFTVVVPPFAVAGLAPARGLRNAAPASNVAVTFSRSLSTAATSTGAIRVFSAQRGGKVGGVASSSGSTLTFNPTNDFKPGETVFTTVGTALQSSAGVNLPYPHVHQFTAAVGGPGRGYLRSGSEVAVGSNPTGVAMGDVDNDGDLDMLTCSYAANTVSVRLNGGDATGSNTGVFSGSQEVSVGYYPNTVVLGDVDNDGDLDLLSACEGVGYAQVNIRLNGGNASGSATGIFSAGSNVNVSSGPTSLALGDVDGDGDLDVLSGSQYVGSVSVLLNQGNGSFSLGSSFSGQRSSSSVALGDVDGDGDLDGVFADTNNGTVVIRLNGGNGTGSNTGVFSAGSDISIGYQPTSVALGDIDGDNDLDLVAGNAQSSVVLVRLNGGDATGSNTGVFSQGTDLTVNAVPRSVVLGDMDADGDLDLVLANSIFNGSVTVYRNGGDASGSNTGTFSGNYNYAGSQYPQQVVLGDVDGDGDLDVLTANTYSPGTVSVRLNTDGGGVLTSAAPAVCAGTNTGTLTLQYAAGTVLSYQADTGGGYQSLAGTTTTLTFSNLTTTTLFRAVVLAPGNQTVYSAPVTVTVRPLPAAGLAAAGPITFCAGGNVLLQATSTIAGGTYQFLRDGQPVGSTGTSSSLTAGISGSYTVLSTSPAGCSSTSAPVAVSVAPLPARPNVTTTTAAGVTTLTSSASSGNQWYFNGVAIVGATAATYVVPVPTTPTGSYTVVATSAQGCASAASQAVVVTSSRQSLPLNAVHLYPNPTPNGQVTIELSGVSNPLEVSVFNALGQEVRRFALPAGHSTHMLDLGKLASGFYVLRVATAAGWSSHVLIRQ